jgi:hypothetical protein
MVNNKDYLSHITNRQLSRDCIGEYQSPLDGKRNIANDLRSVYCDFGKAIKEAHGKIASK